MTPAQLAEIKARCEAATAGPWCCEWTHLNLDVGFCDDKWVNATLADGLFINHARNDIPALLAEVERLRESLHLIRLRSGPGHRIMDQVCSDLMWVCDESRRALDGGEV